MLFEQFEAPAPNWWILGGTLLFVVFTVSIGFSGIPFTQEIIFAGSMAIVLFLMVKLVKVLDIEARRVLVGTANRGTLGRIAREAQPPASMPAGARGNLAPTI